MKNNELFQPVYKAFEGEGKVTACKRRHLVLACLKFPSSLALQTSATRHTGNLDL